MGEPPATVHAALELGAVVRSRVATIPHRARGMEVGMTRRTVGLILQGLAVAGATGLAAYEAKKAGVFGRPKAVVGVTPPPIQPMPTGTPGGPPVAALQAAPPAPPAAGCGGCDANQYAKPGG